MATMGEGHGWLAHGRGRVWHMGDEKYGANVVAAFNLTAYALKTSGVGSGRVGSASQGCRERGMGAAVPGTRYIVDGLAG